MTSCTGPIHEPEGAEWVCPRDGTMPDSTIGETWEWKCGYCQADAARFAELVQDMRYEDG